MDVEKHPGIRFTGVYLTDLHFAMKGPPPASGKIPLGLSFRVSADASEDGKELAVVLQGDLFGDLPEGEAAPAEFTFQLAGYFQAAEGQNLPLKEFARHQAPAHLIPYARELIANVTSRTLLPTLNLGPINVVAMIDSGDAHFEWHQREGEAQQV